MELKKQNKNHKAKRGIENEKIGLDNSTISRQTSEISDITMDDFSVNSVVKKQRAPNFIGKTYFDEELKAIRFETRKDAVAYITKEKFKRLGKNCKMKDPGVTKGNILLHIYTRRINRIYAYF